MAVGGNRGKAGVPTLATALVTGGLPAVLGWEGTVADRAATEFAAVYDAEAAKGLDLAGSAGPLAPVWSP